MDTLVTVVIPTFNAEKYLSQAIQSALDQDFKDREIVVVDDGSTDSTASLLSRYTPGIRVLQQQNGGASMARNRGVDAARGKYVAFLDADDRWLPEKLGQQVAVAEEGVFPVVHTDAATIDPAANVVSVAANPCRQQRNGRVFEEFFMRDISAVLTSTALLRRDCIAEIGGFDETGDVVDDHDFFLRIAWKYPICFINEPLVQYRIVPRSLSRQDAVRRVEQHRRTLCKSIKAHPDFFRERRSLVRRRWRQFNAWAGRMLYYNDACKEAKGYLLRALCTDPSVLPYLGLCFLSPAGRRAFRRAASR